MVFVESRHQLVYSQIWEYLWSILRKLLWFQGFWIKFNNGKGIKVSWCVHHSGWVSATIMSKYCSNQSVYVIFSCRPTIKNFIFCTLYIFGVLMHASYTKYAIETSNIPASMASVAKDIQANLQIYSISRWILID